jgi:iron complex outermembrane receptor protein
LHAIPSTGRGSLPSAAIGKATRCASRRPRNSLPADIKGFELGYQQFYDAFPGFGLQANYTYVDSRTSLNPGGPAIPVQNLSRHSANLVGMYEMGSVSARIACKWRDRYLNGVTNIVDIGPVPGYTADYPWVDASLRYRYDEQVTFGVEVTNLLRTLRHSYYDTPTRPQNAWLNDRQIIVAATVRFW